MRTITTAQDEVLTRGKYKVAVKVEIEDSTATLVDVSDFEGRNWISSVEINENVDEPVATSRIKIFARHYDLSMHPLDEKSKINLPGGVYAPFLDVRRQIRVLTATVPQDYTPVSGDFKLVFDGFIDKIPEPGKRANEITLECRDKGGFLQDTWTEDLERYGDGSVTDTDHVFADLEDITQSILDNWVSGTTLYSENGTGGTPFLPGDTPGFNVEAWDVDIQGVMDAVRIGANSIGWECRYRWQTNVNEFELQLYQPDRANTSSISRTFDPSGYIDIRSLTIDVSRIRNVVEVTYYTDPEDDQSKATIEVSDSASITRYGRRWMGIVEAQSSAINTSGEANLMANAILSDLKEPGRDQEIEMHYFWAAELGDLDRFNANDVNYTTDQDWAVVGIRHFLTPKKHRTFLTTRRAASGGVLHWWDRGQIGGIGDIIRDKIPTAPVVTVDILDHGILIEWTNPQLRLDKIAYYEVHISPTVSFTPDATTLLARTRGTRWRAMGLDQESDYYVKVLSVDREGNLSTNSNEVTSEPGYLRGFPGILDTSLPSPGSVQPGQVILVDDIMYRRWKKTYDELVLDTAAGTEALFYWKLDEPSGGTATDESSNSNDGTYLNTPTLGNAALFNDGGTSVGFLASSDERVELLSLSLAATTDTSFECWFDAAATTAVQTIFDARGAGPTFRKFSGEFQAGLLGALDVYINNTAFTFSKIDKSAFFDQGPVHFAVTWEDKVGAGEIKLYKNGILLETVFPAPLPGGVVINTWYVADRSVGAAGIGGDVDSAVGWVDRVSTASEIRTRVALRGIQEDANFETLSAALGTELRLAARYYLSANQTYSGLTTATVQYDRADYEFGLALDTNTNEVVVEEPGLYYIGAWTCWNQISSSKYAAIDIFVNGALRSNGATTSGIQSSIDVNIPATDLLELVAGDRVRISATNGDNNSRQLVSGIAVTSLRIFKIGAG